MVDPVAIAALVLAGVVAGTVNVVAGGGSFLTLPILIFLGLPPTVANGTNRIGVLVQNVGAVWGFNRHRVLDRSWTLVAAVPATLGAAAGAWAAVHVGDETFRKLLAAVMVIVTLWTLLDPTGSRKGADATGVPEPPSGRALAVSSLAFFGTGLYGGFVQAGVGFLMLAATTAGGLDLVRGNAVKVSCILVFTTLSLAIFASQGMVRWIPGLVLAAGMLGGGQIGVHLTTLKGHAWVKAAVTVLVIVFAIRLWWTV